MSSIITFISSGNAKAISEQLLLVLTGVGASYLHWVVAKDRLSKAVNMLIVHAYSFVIGFLVVLANGQINLANSGSILYSYLLVVGAATAAYGILYSATKAKPVIPANLPVTTTP